MNDEEEYEPDANPIHILFHCINATVELYLQFLVQPFLHAHEKLYSKLNKVLRASVEKHGLPKWCTANFITYVRTLLVIPCLTLMARGWRIFPFWIVIGVDFGDFLDGVVARYWIDKAPEKKKYDYESKGTPQLIKSWTTSEHNRIYGGFIDAVCDKVFIVPIWIFLLSTVEGTRYRILQYIILWCLILAECASGAIRFRAFYTTQGVPSLTGLDLSNSSVKADHVGKAKQTFEMVGTAFFILPWMRYLGVVLLFPAVPLAYESVRRKVVKRVIYCNSVEKFDHTALKFYMQAKTLGSRLIVGVSSTEKNAISNVCASPAVDEVIVEAPKEITMEFLKKYGIDFVLCLSGKHGIVHERVIRLKHCLTLGEGNVVRLVEEKVVHKE